MDAVPDAPEASPRPRTEPAAEPAAAPASPPRPAAASEAGEAASDEDVSLEAILEDLKRREGRSELTAAVASRPMLLVALTGGVGAGKSTVADLLAAHGAVILDADDLARRAVEPGTPGLAKLVDEFGPDILDASGALDRAEMARRAFADPDARRRLEAVVHPEVARLFAEEVEARRSGR